MSDLPAHLAALGLPAPSVVASQLPTQGADVIMMVCQPLVDAAQRTAADLHEMVDVHHALTEWSFRLERELARYGSKVTNSIPRSRPGSTPGCDHDLIDIDEEGAEAAISCRTCGKKINATWWIARHALLVSRAERWRQHEDAERRRILAEIDDLKVERGKLKQQVRRGKGAKR